MAASADPSKTSPKVIATTLVGVGVTLLGAAIAGVTEATGALGADDLPGLGMWAIPAVSFLHTLAQALAGWWKTDPLRLDAVATERAMAALRAELAQQQKGTGGAQTVVG